MRLEINGDLQRSEVFRSQDAVLTAAETWLAAMVEKGLDHSPVTLSDDSILALPSSTGNPCDVPFGGLS